MLSRDEIDALFPADLPEVEYWEQHYPPRELADGAEVTRLGPSPTGFIHIGGIYAAMIDVDRSRRTDGVYVLRIEDTDRAREVEGAIEQFERAFAYFGVSPDEDDVRPGGYGPYAQSARERIYHSYARELMRRGRAYPCFATSEQLQEQTKVQQAQGVPSGYWGKWAMWRDASDDDVREQLAAGTPWVVRFRAPDDAIGSRARFVDEIRGPLEHDANRNDTVILKSSATSPRLPTYHFAHVVDDHLMRITLVIRGEEWISSVPVHLQLFEALELPQVRYAHIAPLMKQIPGGKRKLSKRKDPEASVDFYVGEGFPAPAMLHYLRGLANSRLADMPLERALAEPILLDECGVAGPLVDLAKLRDISGDHIATLTGEQIAAELRTWALRFDESLVAVLDDNRELLLQALAIERDGVDNPRKDLRTWSEFREVYGYFFDELFTPVDGPADERLAPIGLEPDAIRTFAEAFRAAYQPLADSAEWFDQLRAVAAEHGFAGSVKEFKQNRDQFVGSIREASQIVRVALTGSTRSPDLGQVAAVLGADRVLARLDAVVGSRTTA